MSNIDSDLLLEIPDTPDREQHLTNMPFSGRRNVEDINRKPLRRCRRSFQGSKALQSGECSIGVALPISSVTDEQLFRQAEVARLLREDPDAKSFTPGFGEARHLSETRTTAVSNRVVETIDLSQSSPSVISLPTSNGDADWISRRCPSIQSNGSSSSSFNHSYQADVLDTSIANTSVERTNRCDHDTSRSFSSDKGKEIVYHFAGKLSSPEQPAVPHRCISQRRLVRNGCISPNKILKNSRKDGITQGPCSVKRDLPFDGLLHSEDHNGDGVDTLTRSSTRVSNNCVSSPPTKKAKCEKVGITFSKVVPGTIKLAVRNNGLDNINDGNGIMYDSAAPKGPEAIAKSDRLCTGINGVTASIDPTYDFMNSASQGWHSTRNLKNKSIVQDNTKCDRGESHLSVSVRETGRVRTRRGKQKYGSALCNHEASSSSHQDMDTPHPRKSKASADFSQLSVPVARRPPEIVDLTSPEVRISTSQNLNARTCSSSGLRSIQLEADELLARELQEQFYNESPVIPSSAEIDAAIAMSLQNEENARASTSTRRRHWATGRASNSLRQTNNRGTTRAMNRLRHNNSDELRQSNGVRQTRRSFYVTALENLEMNLRATVERATEFLNFSNIGQRLLNDFGENDYETLLALDENNHMHTGASQSQIDNLPESLVQSGSVEDCAICLEKPAVGETIRHLPCLHKFHKECIDEWLKRKTACPVCKYGIS